MVEMDSSTLALFVLGTHLNKRGLLLLKMLPIVVACREVVHPKTLIVIIDLSSVIIIRHVKLKL
jgi:hypothetical protein